jgi:iron complex outermembrane receptor protein
VLKDGASAVYGSDAVAGVINFILRKDYTAGEIGLDVGRAQHGGAGRRPRDRQRRFRRLGRRPLQRDAGRHGAEGGALFGLQRDFRDAQLNVAANNDNTSSHTFPANLIVLDALGKCGQPGGTHVPRAVFAQHAVHRRQRPVRFDPSPLVGLLPKTDRSGLFGSARFMLGETTEAFIEASYNHNEINTVIQPVPFSFIFALPPNNPLYNLPPYNGFFPTARRPGCRPAPRPSS